MSAAAAQRSGFCAERSRGTAFLPSQQVARKDETHRPRRPHVAAAMQQPQQQVRLEEPQAPFARSGLLRVALLSAAAAAASSTQQLLLPSSAWAAPAAAASSVQLLPPLGPARGLSTGPHSSLVLADNQLLPMQPGPIGFPRRQLGLNFAVLLMRSGYDAVDDLDFIPMDEFQKKFWKLRQAEWEPYTLLHSPLRITQGALDSPLYFDFINFSQAAAAGTAMSQGKQVFEEYEEESEGKRLVTRDPSLKDNALLPARFFERQGDRIYRGLVEGFRGEQFGGPLPCAPGASSKEVLAGVESLLGVFNAQGYALKASLTPGPSSSSVGGTTFAVRLEGPANLWSLQALAARRSSVYSQHDAAVVAAFLRASGISSTCRLSWNDTAVQQQWTLAA